ncbi:MAG TPA: enoyl-CoA hydratase-related protein [Nitrospira sp.]|nr:enoyl-CoA hydratase-related protein [Nitrospira sp.]
MTRAESILVAFSHGTARVTLNRPDRRNAFDARMVEELREAFTTLGQDRSVRAIILAGNGPAFCAGADIHWMGSNGRLSAAEARKDATELMKMFRAIDECPCPVIGRIHGAAYGGGVGMMAACDLAVAAQDATFALSELRLGMVPAVIAPLLLRKAGEPFLRRFCLTGEPFSPATAQQWGLVHDVVETGRLNSRIDELVRMIVHLAPQATRESKTLFRRLRTLGDDEQRRACVEANGRARRSAEAREGFLAFVEHRSPVWTVRPEKPEARSQEGTVRDVVEQRA